MICVLVGIIPPKKAALEYLQNKIADISGNKIKWRNSTIANDVDDNDRPTLLVSAVGEFAPEDFLKAVDIELKTFVSESNECNDDSSNEFLARCELWASAPCPLPLLPDGFSVNIQNDKNWLQNATETMQQWGMLTQSSLLDNDQIAELRSLVDAAISETEQLLAKYRPNVNVGQDVFSFKEIASRSKERFDLRLLNLEASNFVKRNIIGHPKVTELLQQTLGSLEELDFDVSVVYSRPGADFQGWHADGEHVGGAKDAGWTQNGWKTDLAQAYAICLFIPLIDLNDEIGYTQFWPGTHRYRNLIGFGKVAEISGSTFDGVCLKGDAIWYDYRLLHRGMPNASLSTLRPVVQIIFKKAWYVERRNYGAESIQGN